MLHVATGSFLLQISLIENIRKFIILSAYKNWSN